MWESREGDHVTNSLFMFLKGRAISEFETSTFITGNPQTLGQNSTTAEVLKPAHSSCEHMLVHFPVMLCATIPVAAVL